MKLTIDFSDFKPWSGAVDTWERIEAKGKIDDLEFMLDELYPDGMSDTSLNDLLLFEPETVFEWLGMSDDNNEEDEDEEEEDEDFRTFCDHFTRCQNCPMHSCFDVDDCLRTFREHKDTFLWSIDNGEAEHDYYDEHIIDTVCMD